MSADHRSEKILDVTCGLIERDGRVLLAQRPPGKALAGQWEFPGGKVEPGETPEDCLVRELREELGVAIVVGEALPPHVHHYGGPVSIRLLPFRCAIMDRAEPVPHEHSALRWCRVEEVALLELAAADLPVLAHYRARIAG